MKQIIVKKREIDLKEFVRRSALETDFDEVIRDSCVLVDEDTGKQLVIYKNLDEEGFDSYHLTETLKKMQYATSTRVSGLKTKSRIFAYAPRVPLRKDFCSATSLANEDPTANELLCEYGRRIVNLYKSEAPEVFESHDEKSNKVLHDYKIKDTPFTSGIVNKNNPLKYHFDSGNFKNVYSCMLAIRENTLGGYLSLPEYGVALEIANNSVTIFDGQSILHGVTPIKYLTPDAFRYTIVYYSLARMWDCLPLDEEVARIRSKKSQREAKRAEAMAFEGVR